MSKLIDGDAHIMELADAFERIDKKFKDRVRVEYLLDDPEWRTKLFDVYFDDKPIIAWKGDRRVRVERLRKRLSEKGFTNFMEPEQIIKDFDTEGIDRVAFYPTLMLFSAWMPHLGADFSAAIARAYNDYIYDLCAVDRRRLNAIAVISLQDVDEAIREAKRCAERGFIGVFVRPNPMYARTLAHEDYWKLWDVLEGLQMTVGIHEGHQKELPTIGMDRVTTQGGHHIVCHPFEQMAAMVSLFEGKIFDKFPKLNFLFLESGTLWAPYWVDRIDAEQDQYRSDHTGRQMAEIFQQQCYLTCEANDPFLPQVIELLGDKRVMLSTDYPHDESTFPHSKRLFDEQKISAEAKERIGRANALEAYPRMSRD